MPFSQDALSRFSEKVMPVPESGCWIWIASLRSDGYGMFSLGERQRAPVAAHRISYEMHRGSIPPGAFVCHRCDTRCCVNPGHLFLGTNVTNMRDMVAKQRSTRGSRHPNAKLSERDIRPIRKRLAAGETMPSIARDFQASWRAIANIKYGHTWSWIPDEEDE